MRIKIFLFLACFAGFLGLTKYTVAQDAGVPPEPTVVDADLGASRRGSKTDDEIILKEEERIKLDGLSVAQMRELRQKAENFTFQAEVNRMMKLIINSLYRNKDIFLRELISNASDALDKIRLLSLTDPNSLNATNDLSIRIKVDKEGRMLHITDTGIGMTKNDLVKNLGTIAKSGTAEFLSKMNENAAVQKDLNDMIGQFGVGFYSAFLVADKVIVSSKHNDDEQHIWESDANSFSIVSDPRGSTLGRGTQVSLELKEEASDYTDPQALKNLVKKYSQFINFPIYLWASKTVKEEVPLDEENEADAKPEKEEKSDEDKEDEVVEEASEDKDKPKTKTVEKTVWDWELLNDNKPVWTRKPNEISEDEYVEFYKALTKDYQEPLAKTHFNAEGEVSFKSLLFVPKMQPSDSFNRYGTVTDNIKLYVRRVFITDEFSDLLPKYLSFLRGVVDSDDLPLNVSRETLQQHKLLKVIKKKLIRKALDMFKKLDPETFQKFWKEYSTNIKLGMFEDPSNRSRLAKLLRFQSSSTSEGYVSLADYVSRMKPKQEHIYYIAGATRAEVEKSPFLEKLLRKGYEVLYLIEAVDEYALSSLPEFEGKKFQNVAKEGLSIAENKEKLEQIKKDYEPLTAWLTENALKDMVLKTEISERLTDSPCALVAGMFGWTGNMERLAMANAHQKSEDPQREYYMKQKKNLEINPKHPIVKDLLRRVKDDPEDAKAKDIALMMFRTATLRSGYMVQDSYEFAQAVETMMKQTLGIPLDEKVDDFDDEDEDDSSNADKTQSSTGEAVQETEADEEEEHDEL
ncbi:endoplasmin homolog [Planococcus citri]|uniref:endoplasmin homolog n=1 Tax=Planococcus citri TaxID=170843 RepID=UPI0031F7701A